MGDFINIANLHSEDRSANSREKRKYVFVGDEGREIYLTFQWNTVQVGSGENRHDIRERDILERVAEKFKAHLEAKKNSIEDANCKGKRLIPSSITTNS